MLESLRVLSRYVSTFDVTGQLVRPQYKKSPERYFAELFAAPDEDKIVKCADRLHNLRTFECWQRYRRVRYVGETEQHVIPLAETVPANPYTAELRSAIVDSKAGIGISSSVL